VLIFDECTSAFRQVLGGHHLIHGVEPDIATFGKTLGNGYAINAVIGRREVMEAASRTFISSTFWTERIGPTAALAALKTMEEEDAPARIHAIGQIVSSRWSEISAQLGLEMTISGLPALSFFSIPGRDPGTVKAFMTHEMLHHGFLAGMALYASIAHSDAVRAAYIEEFARALEVIAKNEDAHLARLLRSGPAATTFARLA
jgi:glutamate-1-semialdehyde 2,1-aminomutase